MYQVSCHSWNSTRILKLHQNNLLKRLRQASSGICPECLEVLELFRLEILIQPCLHREENVLFFPPDDSEPGTVKASGAKYDSSRQTNSGNSIWGIFSIFWFSFYLSNCDDFSKAVIFTWNLKSQVTRALWPLLQSLKSRYLQSGLEAPQTLLRCAKAWSSAFSLYFLWPQMTLSTFSLFHYSLSFL